MSDASTSLVMELGDGCN